MCFSCRRRIARREWTRSHFRLIIETHLLLSIRLEMKARTRASDTLPSRFRFDRRESRPASISNFDHADGGDRTHERFDCSTEGEIKVRSFFLLSACVGDVDLFVGC